MSQYVSRAAVGFLFITVAFDCAAFEPYSLQPSTRAASMAGIFSAQADDSSAIWYNPAGLKRNNSISSEITIDYAQQITREAKKATASTAEGTEYGEEKNGLRFAAGYMDRLPFLTKSDGRWGTGLAYLTLNRLTIDINEPQSPVTTDTFGLIETVNHQVSWLLGVSLTPNLSLGGTVDFVWTDVECLEFSPCVDNPPTGWGGSVGLLYDVVKSERFNARIGAIWRSKADVGYASTPGSGIGTVLELYIPDRPESANLGINFQFPAAWAFINLNVIAEQVRWSQAAGSRQPLPDYTNWGIGSEWIFALADTSSLAFRAGYRQGNSNDINKLPDFQLLTTGVGYFFYKHHSIDLAYEYRDADFTNNNTSSTLSISYSLQY
jgi:long-subunit fatty acid transport protein